MLLLKEIITLISPQKLKNIKLLGGKNSKVRQFYQGIFDGSFIEEEALPEILFPNSVNQKQSYADLKRATKKSLIDALFVVNLEKGTTIDQKTYINCLKHASAANLLVNLGIRKGAITLAEKTLKKAIYNEYTEISLSLSSLLQRYYSTHIKKSNKYYFFTEIVNQQLEHLNKEIKLQSYYSDLIIKRNSLKTGKEIDLLYEQYFAFALQNIDATNVLRVLLHAYRIIVEYCEYHADYQNLIKYSEAAIESFNNKKYTVSNAGYLLFYSKTIPYSFQYKHWQKSEELVDKCLTLLQKKSYNYHAILVYRAMLGFHSGQYQIAYESLKMHLQIKLNSPHLQEQWRMIEAWVMLFAGWGKIKLDDGKEPNFKVFKFINNTPLFSKDKRGNNAAIQILKFLFLFQEERYEQLLDMSIPFKLYAHRYLKSEITARTRLTVRTLCAIADEGFDKKFSIEKATPYLNKLKDYPINFLEQRTVEIVPFEIVAEEIFAQL